MTAQQQHIIGKQILEVRVRKRPGAKAGDYHAVLSRLQRERIQPVLEAVLDSLCPPGQTLRIPQLVIDIGAISPNAAKADWTGQLAVRLEESIQPYLAQALAREKQIQSPETSAAAQDEHASFGEAGSQKSPEHQHLVDSSASTASRQSPRDLTPPAAWEALEIFLLQGHLPWWAGSRPGRYFLDDVVDKLSGFPAPERRARLQRVLQSDAARRRLIAQFRDEKLVQLLKSLQPPAEVVPLVRTWLQLWSEAPAALSEFLSPQWREVHWQAIWQQLLFEWPVDEAMIRTWAQRVLWQLVHSSGIAPGKWLAGVALRLSAGNHKEEPASAAWQAIVQQVNQEAKVMLGIKDTPPKSEQQPTAPGKTPVSAPGEVLYIDNAGLVILAPFLPGLLKNMGWFEQKSFVSPLLQQRAALFLQFLVDGEAMPAPEYLLALNKLLCGLAVDAVMEPQEPFSAEEQAAGEAFLQAVIAHAPVLKNMSPQGFRGTFLWRAGVLRQENRQWLLRVERQDFDLVLDRFPWSFQTIKLSWMEMMVLVEWVG